MRPAALVFLCLVFLPATIWAGTVSRRIPPPARVVAIYRKDGPRGAEITDRLERLRTLAGGPPVEALDLGVRGGDLRMAAYAEKHRLYPVPRAFVEAGERIAIEPVACVRLLDRLIEEALRRHRGLRNEVLAWEPGAGPPTASTSPNFRSTVSTRNAPLVAAGGRGESRNFRHAFEVRTPGFLPAADDPQTPIESVARQIHPATIVGVFFLVLGIALALRRRRT